MSFIEHDAIGDYQYLCILSPKYPIEEFVVKVQLESPYSTLRDINNNHAKYADVGKHLEYAKQ